ncbi:MAG: glycine C-acetyltransferase [Thermodesulfobacteriota bacterium]
MYTEMREILQKELASIQESGLNKEERVIFTPQGPSIKVREGEVINFCANNYLGLSNHPRLIQAAKEGLERYGYGLSSVRFICGTQDIHKELERTISHFLGTEDTILYSSCFDANGGLFETLLNEKDVVISDELNHASIIDGIRLCKAERERYKHSDMEDLEKILKEAQKARVRLIATDGAFSMDGDLAKLPEICELAERYQALVMIDDSHCTGFMGVKGRGTHEFFHMEGRVDIITSTLGKALGGASGGFTSGRKEIIEILRQRSRPYLFSNTLAPVIAYTSLEAIKLLEEADDLRKTLRENTTYFREKMVQAGFQIKPGFHPIVPIMVGEAKVAQDMARDYLKEGIYVIGFSYPVVPKGQARIRVQISAAHTQEHLDRAIQVFYNVGKLYGIVS